MRLAALGRAASSSSCAPRPVVTRQCCRGRTVASSALLSDAEPAISAAERRRAVNFFLARQTWNLESAGAAVHAVQLPGDAARGRYVNLSTVRSESGSTIACIRDDLSHPTLGGNKLRKLDGLLPRLQAAGATDLVACGGAQSAAAAAVAVAASSVTPGPALRAHIVLRGEPLATPTGYNLITHMHACTVTYASRAEYADRGELLRARAAAVAAAHRPSSGSSPPRVAIVPEGLGCAEALLGLIRLVHALDLAGPRAVVIAAGTGTTAVGLALAAKLLGLDWRVKAVALVAGAGGDYDAQQRRLLTDFESLVGDWSPLHGAAGVERGAWDDLRRPGPLALEFVPMLFPRRFGDVKTGEVGECARIARDTGMSLDPLYTLPAWREAEARARAGDDAVTFYHSGGTLGLFGVAQRMPNEFGG